MGTWLGSFRTLPSSGHTCKSPKAPSWQKESSCGVLGHQQSLARLPGNLVAALPTGSGRLHSVQSVTRPRRDGNVLLSSGKDCGSGSLEIAALIIGRQGIL